MNLKEYFGRYIKLAYLEESVFRECIMDSVDYLEQEAKKIRSLENLNK